MIFYYNISSELLLLHNSKAMMTCNIDIGILPIRPSVRLHSSVMLQYCIETAWHVIIGF